MRLSGVTAYVQLKDGGELDEEKLKEAFKKKSVTFVSMKAVDNKQPTAVLTAVAAGVG